jgi:hypothetical protein
MEQLDNTQNMLASVDIRDPSKYIRLSEDSYTLEEREVSLIHRDVDYDDK